MAEFQMSLVQDYILLVHLSRCLRSLAGVLEDCELIDEDDSWIGKGGAPPTELERSPEIAIRRIKTFQNDIWRCELLASAVTLLDLKRPILAALVECREAICQADVPAEMALLDGDAQEAPRICQNAMRLARDRTFAELSRGAALCSAEATILFPHGCRSELVKAAFGRPMEELNLNSIPTLELSSLLKTLPNPAPRSREQSVKKAFLSSTVHELVEYRNAVFEAILQMDNWKCVRMEDFGSRDSAPDMYCRKAIRQCEVAVFIVGHRYGSCPTGSMKSFTEHEYGAAVSSHRPRLVFLTPDDFAMPASEIEDDELRDRQKQFRRRVLTDCVSATFKDPHQLAGQVVISIRNWENTAANAN